MKMSVKSMIIVDDDDKIRINDGKIIAGCVRASGRG